MFNSQTYLCLFLFASSLVFAQKDFVFHNKTIKPGTKRYFEIPINSEEDTTYIPITVFHGS